MYLTAGLHRSMQRHPDKIATVTGRRRQTYRALVDRVAEAVFAEMAALTPIFSAMNYPALDTHHGLQWPCDSAHPQGSPILHQQGFPIGRARLLPLSQVPVAELPDAQLFPHLLQ